ncbi:MAG: hypothetical protein AVDCRST_MAG08-4258 [uncultured Acetobacteraceae bacterium]|jgi:hypothetical protein|uniref:Uncharacterized protein n=1 Tax=uncultured Acetobacteraceae bacterium TaxID=169975 RepID=A0A6J4JSZ4_9PROT|nr:MAG: hypothetical protein AVDCRST_MAG08-4258 [uncultured Acetobacteraceae bacterium]
MRRMTANIDDLFAAERFLAAESRIAGTFCRIEEAVAPLLRAMRARDRTTYATDPERGAIWGHAFLRPPYAPDAAAEWFVAWGLRFPDGGTGWDGAEPPLPRGIHALVALGAEGEPKPGPRSLPPGRLAEGWSVLDDGAASLVAAFPLHGLPAQSDAVAEALAGWTLARLEDLRTVLPDLAARSVASRSALLAGGGEVRDRSPR